MPDEATAGAGRAFQVILKPRGPVCNLSCGYCYYLPKERLYPNADFHMADDVLESFIRQYIEARQGPEVTFIWQGGEPLLMGLDFFEKAADLQRRYMPEETTIYNVVQTNGVLLDDEWCQFFRANGFLVGISIDGPKELHDSRRLDRDGQPTFERVMTGLGLLKKHGVEFNTLTCVHAGNAGQPSDVYRFLRDEAGARYMQFLPVVMRESDTGFPEGDGVTDDSVSGEQYGQFLTTIFNEWVRRDVGTVFVQVFDAALATWMGQSPGLCIFEETCGQALVLEHNGDVYACEHFVQPEHFLGNLKEKALTEMANSEQQVRFGLEKRDALPTRCRQCQVRFVCNGGCPKNRLLRTPDGEPGLNYLCEGYRAFFSYIAPAMGFMAQELQEGRTPTSVMYAIAEQDALMHLRFARAEPDAPCPCGSGRSFRDCHGR